MPIPPESPAPPCPMCGLRVRGIRHNTADSESVCTACFSTLPSCDRCHTATRAVFDTADSARWCRTCIAGVAVCEHCSRYSDNQVPTVTGRTVCTPCAHRHFEPCTVCARWATDTRYLSGGRRVCHDCAGGFTDCGECGTLLPDYTICDACNCGPEVWNYSYKPDPRFHGTGPIYLGMELEIIVPQRRRYDAVAAVTDAVGRLAYLKDDSSIEPSGFELVTHPMDYLFAMREFPWPLLDELCALGCTSDARVGLHVHASRAGFSSPAHIYRWATFLYRNESEVIELAGRRSRYAAFSPQARERIKDTAKGQLRGYDLDRYQAVNPYPRHTLEVRVFAGSLDAGRVQAALAFVAASIEYTRTLTAHDIIRHHGWHWARFTDWVTTHPDYTPLAQRLGEGNARCA